MSATESIVAPTDAQLAYIASLCRERGWPPPEAVHSKREASAIIEAIRASTYRPDDYAPAVDTFEDVPF